MGSPFFSWDSAVWRRASIGLLLAALPALVALVGPEAFAQAVRTSRPAVAPSGGPARSAAAKKPAGDATTPPAANAATSPTPASIVADAGVGVVEARTLDGGTRAFKFSELDIEGRLKNPQLVYFLRRVRAEFAAGDLGHRPFLGEMSESRKESSF